MAMGIATGMATVLRQVVMGDIYPTATPVRLYQQDLALDGEEMYRQALLR